MLATASYIGCPLFLLFPSEPNQSSYTLQHPSVQLQLSSRRQKEHIEVSLMVNQTYLAGCRRLPLRPRADVDSESIRFRAPCYNHGKDVCDIVRDVKPCSKSSLRNLKIDLQVSNIFWVGYHHHYSSHIEMPGASGHRNKGGICRVCAIDFGFEFATQ